MSRSLSVPCTDAPLLVQSRSCFCERARKLHAGSPHMFDRHVLSCGFAANAVACHDSRFVCANLHGNLDGSISWVWCFVWSTCNPSPAACLKKIVCRHINICIYIHICLDGISIPKTIHPKSLELSTPLQGRSLTTQDDTEWPNGCYVHLGHNRGCGCAAHGSPQSLPENVAYRPPPPPPRPPPTPPTRPPRLCEITGVFVRQGTRSTPSESGKEGL